MELETEPANSEGEQTVELTIVHLILVAMLAFVAMLDGVGPKVLLIALPLVGSAGVGVIFGNMQVAVLTGAAIQIMFLAAIPIGGASPPDGTSASIVGASLAEIFYTGSVPPTSVELINYYAGTVVPYILPFAVVVAVIGVQLDILARTSNIVCARRAAKFIEKGDVGGVQTSHLLGFIPWGLSRAVLCPIAIYLGVQAVSALVSLTTSIESTFVTTAGLLNGLTVAGSVLPAVGFAVILSILPFGRMRWFFVMGFVISSLMIVFTPWLGLIATAFPPVLIATGVGFLTALVVMRRRYPSEHDARGLEKRQPIQFKNFGMKDLSSTFRRYFFAYEASWNYERMQGLGYLYCMMPLLKKLHKDKRDLKDAMRLHMEFFNTNPFIASWIIGMNAKVEDEGASPETVRSIKVGYMGPLAGIGDSLIYFVIGGLAILIGSYIAFDFLGNILGIIVLWGITVPTTVFLRFWFFRVGLRRGLSTAKQMTQGKGLKRIMELTGAVGVTTIGAFIPTAVQVGLPVASFSAELQVYVNAVSLLAVPLTLTLIAYFFARRGFSIVRTMLVLFTIGFLTGLVGLLTRPIYIALEKPALESLPDWIPTLGFTVVAVIVITVVALSVITYSRTRRGL
jgi:PTS system mannose-specific IID component